MSSGRSWFTPTSSSTPIAIIASPESRLGMPHVYRCSRDARDHIQSGQNENCNANRKCSVLDDGVHSASVHLLPWHVYRNNISTVRRPCRNVQFPANNYSHDLPLSCWSAALVIGDNWPHCENVTVLIYFSVLLSRLLFVSQSVCADSEWLSIPHLHTRIMFWLFLSFFQFGENYLISIYTTKFLQKKW